MYTIVDGQPVLTETRTSRLVAPNGDRMTYAHQTLGASGVYILDANGEAVCGWQAHTLTTACRWVADHQRKAIERAERNALISTLLTEYRERIRNI